MWSLKAALLRIFFFCSVVFILSTFKFPQNLMVNVKNNDYDIRKRYNANTELDEERNVHWNTENEEDMERFNESNEGKRSEISKYLKSQRLVSRKNEINVRNKKIHEMIERLELEHFFPQTYWNTSLAQLTRELGNKTRRNANTLSGYANLKTDSKEKFSSWKMLHANIRQFSLYDPDDPNLEQSLHEMASLQIISAELPSIRRRGTQFKLIFEFPNGGRAMMKPMRYPREVEADENHYIFDDKERHIAEIAAFQLDKLLGFYRVPPTIGRKINITSELMPVSPSSVNETLFTSPAGNICFYGKCKYFCDHAHAFCGHPDSIEISLQSYLPSESIAPRRTRKQPWRRAYSIHEKARWETNDDACDFVRTESPYNNGKLLQDIVDVHTFDFLTGNKDRHNIAMFKEFEYYSFPILFDNGRGFGRQTYDAMSILAPLRQCCLIRKSTFLKYIKLFTGTEKLSVLMEKALESDPVAPVLIQGHLNALDRRLVKILETVATCLNSRATQNVIVSDEF